MPTSADSKNKCVANSSPATHQTLRQSSYTPNSTAVQLHTKLYGGLVTHQTLRQSSYTPNSTAVQLHTKLYGGPVTHQTLRQSSYTPNSTAVQLHTKLYGSPVTHQTLRQSSYTPNSTAAKRHWRRQPYISLHFADCLTLSVAAVEKKTTMRLAHRNSF